MLELALAALLFAADAPSLPPAPPRPPEPAAVEPPPIDGRPREAAPLPPKEPTPPKAPEVLAPEKRTARGAKDAKDTKGEKDAKGEKKEEKKEEAPVPPSLTAKALRAELRREKALEARAGGGGERQRLEELAAEIGRAREALRQDTQRLEAMIRGGGGRMPYGDGVAPASVSDKEMQPDQIDAVSKAMKGMKPEQAAGIVSRMDRSLAAEILRRMRPADAGLILGQLKPELGAELATAIATRRPIGGPAREAKP